MDANAATMMATYKEAIRCEVLRAEVFAGQRTPMLFGEPRGWMALLVEALRVSGRSEKPAARARLRAARRFDAAPPTCGHVGDEPFDWIATPTRASGRSWRRSSTAATTGFRSRASRESRSKSRRPARPRLDAGGSDARQRRRDRRLMPDALPGLGERADGRCWHGAQDGMAEAPAMHTVGLGQRLLATNDGGATADGRTRHRAALGARRGAAHPLPRLDFAWRS